MATGPGVTNTLIPPPQCVSTDEDWDPNPVYVQPSRMQRQEWEIQAAHSEIATLQVKFTLLETKKEDLQQKLVEREMENEDLLDELHRTDQRLQDMIKISKACEKELQERISYLEKENEQGKSELLERIAHLERDGEVKEREIKQRERECERVEEFFKGGNDVNGLILDLKGRLKKQDEELHIKSTEIDSLRHQLKRVEVEKVAFQQTLANLGTEPEVIRCRTTSSGPSERKSKGSSLGRPAPKLTNKQPSLSTIDANPHRGSKSKTKIAKQKRMSMDDTYFENRIYDKPISPTRDLKRLPFSLKWDKSCHLDSRKKMVSGSSVYSHKEDTLFFSSSISQEILAYKTIDQKWFSLAQCPHQFFGLAIVDDYLTAVGGATRQRITSTTSEGSETSAENDAENDKRYKLTNRLVCYVKRSNLKRNEESWVEIFPSMPTERANVSAVGVGPSLIVAGGDNGKPLQTVEVMDTRSKHWYTATSLPKALSQTTLVLCENTKYLYLVGEEEKEESKVAAVYNCSAQELLRTRERIGPQSPQATTPFEDRYDPIAPRVASRVWNELPNAPTLSSTLVVVNSHVVAIGGINDKKEDSHAIYYLDIPHSKWEHIAHMPTARHKSLAGYDPSTKKLVVIGGFTKIGTVDSLDIAHIII